MSKLWRVTEGRFCGGFAVRDDRVIASAPFLRQRVMGKTEVAALQSVMTRPDTRVEQVRLGRSDRCVG